jgi:hypothetical protein
VLNKSDEEIKIFIQVYFQYMVVGPGSIKSINKFLQVIAHSKKAMPLCPSISVHMLLGFILTV